MRRGHHHARACSAGKPRLSPLCGFIQTTRWLSRERRSMAARETSGSPRSSPSEQTTTTPPRHNPRRPHSRTKASSDSPIRVPPSQSNTVAAASFERASIRPAMVELPRDPRQPRAEAEHLDFRSRPFGRVGELQEVPRVVGHRPGDVEDQDQRPHADPPAGARTARPAPRASASTPGWSARMSGARPGARGTGAPRSAARGRQTDPRHDPAQRRQLFGRTSGERLVLEGGRVGRHQPEHRLFLCLPLSGLGARERQRRLRLAADARLEHQHLGARRAVAEEVPAECLVVHGDLVVAADQRRAARPSTGRRDRIGSRGAIAAQ